MEQEIKRIIKGEVITSLESCAPYRTDTSLFDVTPQLVVLPKDTDDIQALVSYVSRHSGVSLTVRSGGTGMDGGALSESIVVDVNKHLRSIIKVGSGYAITQPGVFYRDFEKETLKENQLMPSYPASREICTVGGMVANNSGGELTLAYGKTEKYVKHLKVVLADGNEYTFGPLTHKELDNKLLQKDFEGEIYRNMYTLINKNYDSIQNARPQVSKNSAGYYLWDVWNKDKTIFDLTKLFVGSQGTLGIITEITFELVQKPKHEQMMILFLDSFDRLGEMVKTVLTHKPTTFESYDDKTLALALRFFGNFIKRLGFKNLFTLVTNGIPEMFSILFQGIPKLVLQITFNGNDPTVLREKALKLQSDLKQYSPRYMKTIKNPHEADEYWLIRRESFNLLRNKVRGMKTAPFIDDIVVDPKHLPVFLPKLMAILDEYKEYMIHNIAGHIGNGNFHIIPLMDLSNPKAKALIPEIAQKVYSLVFAYNGSATGEHNDGIIRTPFLKQQFGEQVYKLFEETKRIFDPKNIFNPGKKVGGTMEYAMSKIKTRN